jgi:uracil-DNA glycosylase
VAVLPAPEPTDASVGAVLAGPIDSAGFRRHARALLAAGVAPHRVRWTVRDASAPGLFDAHEGEGGDAPDAAPAAAAQVLRVPSSYATLADTVMLHRDPGRHALLYRLLWRLQHEPGYWHDTLDADRVRAETMARAVRRDRHKMKAFVRFRPIARGDGLPPLHVAWFEPGHHIVESVAPFFTRRFTQMCWTVLTPLRSVSWDGSELVYAPGALREDAPAADAGEALWLTYYSHIFNPARLKIAMMRKEMPRRYWKNLPEAALITPLVDGAHQRSGHMLAAEPTAPARYAQAAAAAAGAARHGACAGAGHAAAAAKATAADSAAAPPTPSLAATRDAAAQCQRCPLHRDATQVVFGEGPAQARWMFVGEQPGDHEDLQGRPFVGPAGRLLDRVLAQIGIARDAVYLTNAVKHFKFELRGRRRIHKTPAQQEAAACLDWLEREVDLVAPQVIVALGATAARALLGRAVAVTQERGQWLRRHDGRPVRVTLHPAALLRLPPDEQDAAVQRWIADLAMARQPPDDWLA